jgi:hypothetical protein
VTVEVVVADLVCQTVEVCAFVALTVVVAWWVFVYFAQVVVTVLVFVEALARFSFCALVDVLLDLVDEALVGHFVADAVFVQGLVEYFVVVDVTVIVETWTLWVTVTGTVRVIVVVLAGFVTVEVVVDVTTGGVCVVVVVLKMLVGTTTVIGRVGIMLVGTTTVTGRVGIMSVGTETVTGGTAIMIAEVEDGDGTAAGAPQAPSGSMRLVSSVTAPPRA